MEMNERIRYVRKDMLHMTQTAFAEALGVSRDVIKNIELDVLKRPEQKRPLIKLMSEKFHVSEQWLLTGEGEIESDPDHFSLDAYARQRGASDLDVRVLKAYFSVDAETRKRFMEQFERILENEAPDDPAEMTMEQIDAAADRKRAEYRQQLIDEKKAAEKSSASNITKAG